MTSDDIPAIRPERIPRISHDQRHATAQDSIQLHMTKRDTRPQTITNLGFILVAGVGFEPT